MLPFSPLMKLKSINIGRLEPQWLSTLRACEHSQWQFCPSRVPGSLFFPSCRKQEPRTNQNWFGPIPYHTVWEQGTGLCQVLASRCMKWDRNTCHFFSLCVSMPLLKEVVSSYPKDKLSGQTSKGACIPIRTALKRFKQQAYTAVKETGARRKYKGQRKNE